MELLIVVGIIALLTAIIALAFRGVRAQARRTTCAANLHGVGLALGTYAMSSRRWLPTRFQGVDSVFDTFRMRTNDGQYRNLGLLLPYLDKPETFYCPSQDQDGSPGIAYNTRGNPWGGPPGQQARASRLALPVLLAPVAGWNGVSSTDADNSTTQPGVGNSGPGPGVNSSFPARACHTGAATPRWTTLNYGNKVVYSDFIGVDDWPGRGRYREGLQAPHDGAGCNRLFGEGSVGWAPSEPLNRLRPITASEPTMDQLIEYYQLLDVLP